jgi:hypothetical protein
VSSVHVKLQFQLVCSVVKTRVALSDLDGHVQGKVSVPESVASTLGFGASPEVDVLATVRLVPRQIATRTGFSDHGTVRPTLTCTDLRANNPGPPRNLSVPKSLPRLAWRPKAARSTLGATSLSGTDFGTDKLRPAKDCLPSVQIRVVVATLRNEFVVVSFVMLRFGFS